MNQLEGKRTDYAAAYALFNLPAQHEPRWDQDPMHFKKVSLLTQVNVSYSANSSTVAPRKA